MNFDELAENSQLPPAVIAVKMGLVGAKEKLDIEPLTGGVSSDIWRVSAKGKSFVVKRARGQLDVGSRWEVPIDRGEAEVEWLTCVAEFYPDHVPEVLGYDSELFAIALNYYSPNRYSNWKLDLLGGQVDTVVAGEVGRVLGGIHSETFARKSLAARFNNSELFHLLRIEPFLQDSAIAVPKVKEAISEIIDSLLAHQIALVHGDFSPKNILIDQSDSTGQPVVLDAECATWGDPAFDVAFCLAHLALKSVHVDNASEKFADAAHLFRSAYFDSCPQELATGISQRLIGLVPALLLARVVGRSPVEYLTERERSHVQRAATESLLSGMPCGELIHKDKSLGISPW